MTFKYGDRWCLQQPGEVLRGIKLFQDFDVKRVLEIGYWEGGLHAILNDFGIDVVSVDPAPRGVLLPTVIIVDVNYHRFTPRTIFKAAFIYSYFCHRTPNPKTTIMEGNGAGPKSSK